MPPLIIETKHALLVSVLVGVFRPQGEGRYHVAPLNQTPGTSPNRMRILSQHSQPFTKLGSHTLLPHHPVDISSLFFRLDDWCCQTPRRVMRLHNSEERTRHKGGLLSYRVCPHHCRTAVPYSDEEERQKGGHQKPIQLGMKTQQKYHLYLNFDGCLNPSKTQPTNFVQRHAMLSLAFFNT